MNRKKARETTFCLIFEKDFNPEFSWNEVYDSAVENFEDMQIDSDPYIKRVFGGVFEKIDELDEIINSSSDNWEADRISRVSRAILRLAAYEIKYEDDIPLKIAVNEAVELAKKFDDEKSFSFVNGVLANVAKSITE